VHKKYSHHLINLRLSHSALYYFNYVFNTFSGLASFNPLEAMEKRSSSQIWSKNILICVKDEQYINDEKLAHMQKTATYPVPNDLSQSSICLEVAL